MTTNRSSKVAGWTGGGKRGAAARKLFNAQREQRTKHSGKTIESWKTRYNGSVLVTFTDGSWGIFLSKQRAILATRA